MISKISSHLGPGSIFSGEVPLTLVFDNTTWISASVGDYTNINDWITFFGMSFSNLSVNGTTISLIGGEDLILQEYRFLNSDLVSINDSSGIIKTLGTYSFSGCSFLESVKLPGVTYSFGSVFYQCSNLNYVSLDNLQNSYGGELFYNCSSLSNLELPSIINLGGDSNFESCTGLTNLYLPLCTTLGSDEFNNDNFNNIFGQTISLTVTPELMTCNAGSPDVDIDTLVSNNTVTINIPTSITSFTPTIATYSGTTMSVTGKGFYSINSVKLGGVEVASYSLDTFTSMSITTGTVSTGSLEIVGTYGSASKSGFEWDVQLRFEYLASTENISIGTSSKTWADLSDYGNDLTLFDGVTPSNSYSLEFDGSNLGYGISPTMSVNYPVGFTIETWVKFSSFNASNYIMQFVNTDSTNSNPLLVLNSYGTDLLITSDNTVYLGATLLANQFTKLVVTFDSSTNEAKGYVDGLLTGTGSLSPSGGFTKTIGQLYIGDINSNQTMHIGKLKFTNEIQDASTILNTYESEKDFYDETLGSYVFDSSLNQYLSSSSSDYEIGTQSFTLEAFVKTATQSGFDGIISLLDQNTLNGVAININSGYFDFESQSGQTSSYTMSNDTWYHVAISRENGTMSYFVDGSIIAQYADTYTYSLQDLVIGRYYTDVDDYYIDGYISQPRLTIGQSIYNSPFGVIPPLTSSANTKLLLVNRYNNKLLDSSGLTHSVTNNNNVGWTSSIPSVIGAYTLDSLQLYLDASTSYPGSGTTWYDISGNSRNFSFPSGHVTYNSDNGGHFIFDGTHDIGSIGYYSISMLNGFTMEVVCQVSAGSSNGIFTFNGGGDYINIQAYGTYLRWEVDGGQSFNSISGLSPNTWVNITCTYDGTSSGGSGTGKIYINGVLNNSESKSASRSYNSTAGLQNSQFVLGRHDNYLTGKIALVRFYNKALDQTEVTRNFEFSKSRFGL